MIIPEINILLIMCCKAYIIVLKVSEAVLELMRSSERFGKIPAYYYLCQHRDKKLVCESTVLGRVLYTGQYIA